MNKLSNKVETSLFTDSITVTQVALLICFCNYRYYRRYLSIVKCIIDSTVSSHRPLRCIDSSIYGYHRIGSGLCGVTP